MEIQANPHESSPKQQLGNDNNAQDVSSIEDQDDSECTSGNSGSQSCMVYTASSE